MTDYSKTLIKGTSVIFIATISTSLIGYFLKLLLAKNLTITEFGLVYSIIALFGVFLILPGIGSGKALVRFITEYKTKNKLKEIKTTILTSFLINMCLSLTIGLILIIFSEPIALNYLHDITKSSYIRLYAIAFILTPTISIFKSIFAGFKKSKYYSIIDLSKMLTILIFAYIFLKLNLGVTGVFLAYILVYILPIIFYFPLLIKKVFPTFLKVKAGIKSQKAKRLIKFGIPLTIASTAGMIFGYMDTVIITFFRSLEEVALYNVGLPTIRIVWNFERALTVILFPIAVELWLQKDKTRFRNGIKNLYKYILIIIIPFTMVLFIFPELILKVLFGQAFVGAASVVRILAITSLIIVLARINIAIITSIGKPSIITKVMVIGALINIIINLILIPIIGINGAAISTAAAFSFILIYTHNNLKKLAQINFPVGKIIKILLISTIITITAYILKEIIQINIYLESIIIILIGMIIYTTLIFVFKVLTPKEVKNLLNKLKNK
ncbi:MAG: flippase [Candidatus Woesearchaeota archaeon]